MLDFHNHLIPGVDDGARDLAESASGLAAMAGQGVKTIIATPHMPASLANRKAEFDKVMSAVDTAWESLAELVSSEFPSLRIERGVELNFDVPHPDVSDIRLRLAGTSFILIEFPGMNIPPGTTIALRELRAQGCKPVIAHPERYSNMSPNFDLLESWKDAGAFIQVNAGSVVGQYGTRPKEVVWRILSEGLADFLCSDYHSRGRLSITAAGEELDKAGGRHVWQRLVDVNPNRLLRDEDPLPVDAVTQSTPPLWKRMLNRR